MKLTTLILILMPFTTYGLTVSEWLEKYQRKCSTVAVNQVCKSRLDSALKRMKNSIVPKMLEDAGLPIWLATIGIVESDYNNDAVSSAGEVGDLQVMPTLVQTYFTKKTITKGVSIYSGKLKFTETITETKPTIESCKWLGKDPKIRVRTALEAAEAIVPSVRGPMVLLVL